MTKTACFVGLLWTTATAIDSRCCCPQAYPGFYSGRRSQLRSGWIQEVFKKGLI